MRSMWMLLVVGTTGCADILGFEDGVLGNVEDTSEGGGGGAGHSGVGGDGGAGSVSSTTSTGMGGGDTVSSSSVGSAASNSSSGSSASSGGSGGGGGGSCVPKTCQPGQCEVMSDGCDTQIFCGNCTLPQACGSGGTNYCGHYMCSCAGASPIECTVAGHLNKCQCPSGYSLGSQCLYIGDTGAPNYTQTYCCP